MSDPIGAAARGLGSGRTLGPDAGHTYTVDIGKGAHPFGPGSFGETIGGFVDQVSGLEEAAGDLRARYLRGEPVEIHTVTAAAEEAGIALDLMVEIRNKVLDAYRTLVNMQS